MAHINDLCVGSIVFWEDPEDDSVSGEYEVIEIDYYTGVIQLASFGSYPGDPFIDLVDAYAEDISID